jgi:parvulin-like peptidyl-prolyl isomerase
MDNNEKQGGENLIDRQKIEEKPKEVLFRSGEEGKLAGVQGLRVKLNVRRLILGIVAGVFIVLFVGLFILGFGLYKYDWDNDFTNKMIKIIPFPAVVVNWKPLSYLDYREDIKTLIKFYDQQKSASPDATVPDLATIKKDVLDRAIKNELAAQIAEKRYNIKVSQQEIDDEFQKVVEQSGSQDQAEKILSEIYGWSVDQFKKKVLEPFLLQQKLQEAVAKDASLNPDKEEKAKEILAEVKDGKETFEDLAKKYSEDSSAADGGDLGYFGRGEMADAKEFEDAAFKLGPGEVSDLVQTRYGYHIIKVEDVLKNDAGEVTQVHARHILIKTKNLDDFLNEEMAKAKIWRLVKTAD